MLLPCLVNILCLQYRKRNYIILCCVPSVVKTWLFFPGVWPDDADGTDVNNCSMSHDKKLLVSADDFGKVNLYEYPSIQPRVSLCWFTTTTTTFF